MAALHFVLRLLMEKAAAWRSSGVRRVYLVALLTCVTLGMSGADTPTWPTGPLKCTEFIRETDWISCKDLLRLADSLH